QACRYDLPIFLQRQGPHELAAAGEPGENPSVPIERAIQATVGQVASEGEVVTGRVVVAAPRREDPAVRLDLDREGAVFPARTEVRQQPPGGHPRTRKRGVWSAVGQNAGKAKVPEPWS